MLGNAAALYQPARESATGAARPRGRASVRRMLDVAAARIVPAVVPGPVGPIEALVRIPAEPRGAAVVAHPHPLHGGTLHTKVVHRAARLLADRFSLTALRFNFRGVGASAGVHDGGRGEVLDLVAAARHVRAEAPSGPLVLGGFSFGSVCALRAAEEVRPDLLFLIGVPLARFEGLSLPDAVPAPVVWLHGAQDAYGAPEAARALAVARGWDLSVVPEADHFFAGRLDRFEEEAVRLLSRHLGEPLPA